MQTISYHFGWAKKLAIDFDPNNASFFFLAHLIDTFAFPSKYNKGTKSKLSSITQTYKYKAIKRHIHNFPVDMLEGELDKFAYRVGLFDGEMKRQFVKQSIWLGFNDLPLQWQ